MKRLLFFIVFMTLGTLGFYLLLVPEPFRKPPFRREAAEPPPANVLTMRSVNVRQQDGERLAWELTADEAVLDDASDVARLTAVRFTLYEQPRADAGPQQAAAGRVLLTGEAGRAVLLREQDRLVLQGAVRLQQRGGMELRGERVEYDHTRGELRAPTAVQVRTDGLRARARGLVYRIGEETLELDGPTLWE